MPTAPLAGPAVLAPPAGAQSTPLIPTEPLLPDEVEPDEPDVPEEDEPDESDAPDMPDEPLEVLGVLEPEEGSSVLLAAPEVLGWLDASIPVDDAEVEEDCAYANPEAANNAKNNGDKRDIISP